MGWLDSLRTTLARWLAPASGMGRIEPGPTALPPTKTEVTPRDAGAAIAKDSAASRAELAALRLLLAEVEASNAAREAELGRLREACAKHASEDANHASMIASLRADVSRLEGELTRAREAASRAEAAGMAAASSVVEPRPKQPDGPPERERRGGGKRLAELERRVAEAEQRATRLQSRAEDAERALAEGASKHRAELDEREAHHREKRLRLEERARTAERALGRESDDGPRQGRDAERKRPAAGSEGGLAEIWWSPGEECFEAIARRIDDASETIDVCVFTITDDRLANALLAAHRRGVRVRVVTDNDKADDEGSDARRLARGGIEVRVDRTEFHMHHKFAVFDRARAITGSYNWTRGAARNNEEHVLVTNDPRFVDALGRGFEALWKKFAE